MDVQLNPVHVHRCYSCSEELVCACADRRQTDRLTGKERRILCVWCADLEKWLKVFFGKEVIELERVQ